MPPHAWLVDLDGTLYRSAPLKRAMALRVIFSALAPPNFGAAKALRTFRIWHERLREADQDCVPHPFAQQVQRAAEELGWSAEDLERLVQDWMVDRPSKLLHRYRRQALIDELRAHRAAGGRLALVSDYPARAKLEGLGLADLFEVIVANGEAGSPPRLKPHPAGYLLAAERLGVPPANCLVIGDRDDADGEAARRAGMGFRQVK